MATLQQIRHRVSGVSVVERPASQKILLNRSHRKVKSTCSEVPRLSCPQNDSSQHKDDNSHNQKIQPEQILLQSQEKNYSNIYEINLHASGIERIENLTQFRKLRQLDLSCNHIHTIENLQSNTDLRELKLYDNDICRVENLDCLTQLSHLQLQYNSIANIGNGLAKLKNLTDLRLDNNQLTTISSSDLSQCSRLAVLDLSNNQLEDISVVRCLGSLRELRASGNRLQQIPDLSSCRKLQDIDVSYNHISTLRGSTSQSLSQLQILNISHNRVSSLKSIGRLGCLVELIAAGNNIDSLSIGHTLYPSLEILDVSDNKIPSVQNLECLMNCPSLVELYVTGNPLYNEDTPQKNLFAAIHQSLPNLEILDKAHVKKISHPSGTPLMRPMSAASVITVRKVKGDISHICNELKNLEVDINKKFAGLRSSCTSLLSHDTPRCTPASSISSGQTAAMVTSPLQTTGGGVRQSPASEILNKEDDEDDDDDAPDIGAMTSRCSSRQRILEAQNFAAENF